MLISRKRSANCQGFDEHKSRTKKDSNLRLLVPNQTRARTAIPFAHRVHFHSFPSVHGISAQQEGTIRSTCRRHNTTPQLRPEEFSGPGSRYFIREYEFFWKPPFRESRRKMSSVDKKK